MKLFKTLLATLGLLAALAPSVQAAEQKLVTIGFQKGSGLLALLKAQGTLEKSLAAQQQQVRWIEFPAGPQMLEALNTGSIDFGSTGAPPPVFGQAAGIDLLYVGAEPAPVHSEAIFVPKESPLTEVKQLKGKKVAFQKGSGSHFLLLVALQKAGLTMRDVTPIYLAPAEARAAFVSGKIDAWVVWDPYFASAQQAYQVRVLADYQGLPLANGFYLASRKFASQSPQLLSAVLGQIRDTGVWANTHQKEIAALVGPLTGLPPDIVAIWQGRSRYGAVPVNSEIVANQQRVADAFYQQKLIPKKVEIAGSVWQWRPAR